MKNAFSLVLFLVLVLGGGLAIGYLTGPGDWYGQLAKPAFNPPGWVFGPVWTTLYVLIAVAGWRVWRIKPTGLAMMLWWAQLVLNFAWSPSFFVAHQLGLAFVVILLLLASILGFIIVVWRHDRLASSLFAPYAAWVAFAATLNGAIFLLN
jgi:tryptophan-rich sensory protein